MSNFVFTGVAKLEGIHLERPLLTALAKEQGHVVQSRVDKTTHYLVLGETKDLTTKWRKAIHCNTQTLSVEQFLQKMNYL